MAELKCARVSGSVARLGKETAEMTLTRILLPTDFSDTARRALDYAGELARRFDASVHGCGSFS